ncbi:MAG TPA: dihydrodipicolinate synthase family protein [Clostridiales bacterium]|nr:dihydrodipicolinate synthase family protein [Clostridiales bacterium]
MTSRKAKVLKKLAKGAFLPAMPLALYEDGSFDEASQRRLIRYYMAAEADGLAVAVHTTQFEIRRPEHNLLERVLAVAADELTRFEEKTGQTVVKIAGACGPAEQAVSEAKPAKSLGYDAVLLSPGGLSHRSEEYLLARTKEVASVLPVVGFYLQTAVGGRRFSYDYWQKLCDIDNVFAIKCASFDRYSTTEVVRAAAFSPRADKIALYTGNDDHILLDLLTTYHFGDRTKGFVGGLLGHWAVWVKPAVELFRKAKQGLPTAELLTLAAQVTDMNAALFDVANDFVGCIAGVNEVLYRQGLLSSPRCLNPAEVLSKGQAEEIDRVCALYPHLTDDGFVAQFLQEGLN